MKVSSPRSVKAPRGWSLGRLVAAGTSYLPTVLLSLASVVAAGARADAPSNPGAPAPTAAKPATDVTCPGGDPPPVEIPEGTRPCEHPEYWRCSVASAKHDFLVHYRTTDEEETAKKVVTYLDTAWEFEVRTLGFRAPVYPDAGCGPDGRFDVFLWRGHVGCAVDAIDPSAETGVSCSPVMTYMLLDPWGKYGGDVLRQTIGHEFNHASQAVLDWNETLIALEMTASYVEQYFWDAFPKSVLDFQRNPERSLLWVNASDTDDRTYLYMYGSALYMRFLRDRYFPADERFASRLWEMLPNVDCTRNSPNIVDGIDRLLHWERPGASFLQSAIEFARWRYYTGSRDDHRHFWTWPMPFAQFPFIAEAELAIDGTASVGRDGTTRYQVARAPMILGTSYVEVSAADAAQTSFEVTLLPKTSSNQRPSTRCSARRLKWVVQAIPGLGADDDGEIVDVSRGPARVAFARAGDGTLPSRTLAVSLLPTGCFDPDDQCQDVFPFELRLSSP